MDQAGIYHTGISKGHHHKGPRQAGNKSLLSFRAGHGITGYIGFIPSTESIPIPNKEGPSRRADMNADRSRAFPEWEFAKPLQQETIYMNTYDKIITAKNPRPDSAPLYAPPKPSKTRADDFGGVGEDRPKPRAFIATSTNKADFTGGKYNNLVPSRVTRPKSAFIAPSTYAVTYETSVEMACGKDFLAKKPPRPDLQYGKKWKEVIVQPGPAPTTYQTDYGEFGDGQMERLPDHHLGFSEHGTTKHLFTGTTKLFKRMPGYCGFMPSTNVNGHAIRQATNDHERKDPKNCRLFHLNQYLLEIPGASIFQPQDASNLMAEPKGREGTATAYQNAIMSNPATLATLAKQRAEMKTYGSTQATKSFFQGGQVTQSENGVKNAEAFYRLVRPFEGLPRVLRPSLTTESGYQYGCYMNKI